MRLTYLLLTGVLAAMLIAGTGSCASSLESRLGPVLYDVYLLKGTREYSSAAGAELASLESDTVIAIMDDFYLDANLFYHHTDKANGTRLFSTYVNVRDGSHLGLGNPYINDGTMLAEGGDCTLELDLPDPPEGYTDITLSGTFDRDDAQTAIDRLRKSTDAPGKVEGDEQFVIHWEMSGLLDSIPFTVVFSQVFVVFRNRIDVSPVPG